MTRQRLVASLDRLDDGRVAWAVALAVAAMAFVRMWPPVLVYEEPLWLREASPTNLFEPWNGFVQVFARVAFLVAQPFGDGAPLVTRIIAAGAIGVVAGYLASSAAAIPHRPVRVLAALALPILPTAYPGPYIGPLNSQWWIALAVVLIALNPPRRWHWPALVVAGLAGASPCLAVPAFRDRRGLVLLVVAVAQVAVFAASSRRPEGLEISRRFLVVAIALAAVMALPTLPARTRLAVAYLGLALILFGSIATGGAARGQDRYLAVPLAGIALGVVALAFAAYRWYTTPGRSLTGWRGTRGAPP